MNKYFRIYALVIIILILVSQVVHTDQENNSGYIGYDPYFLNSFDVDISKKNVVLKIDDDKLTFNGEYILCNQTDKTVEVILGLPYDDVEDLIILDKNNPLKFFWRNFSYIENNYIFEHLPKADKWSIVSIWLKANESRVIRISYQSQTTNDSKGIYTLTYMNNAEPNNSSNSKAYIVFNDFKPYNAINVSNIEVEKVHYNQGLNLLFDIDNNGRAARIDYELTDKLAIDRLSFATSSKLKNISNLYGLKDYDAVILLCDEYINNPSDNSVDINQVKYVKSEAYRNLTKFDNYFEVIESLDLNKLYPYRLKYKILLDVYRILNGKAYNSDLATIIVSIQNDLQESNEFFSEWMVQNKIIHDDIDITLDMEKEETRKEGVLNKYAERLKLDTVGKFLKDNWYIYLISVLFIFLIGFLLGRKFGKKKTNPPYYTFRR
ncbi:MAG: hypothetical protein M0P77_05615 [Firmicutes bacterium]|nr:hypothetical protein [Bacillota bacterium]